MTHVPALPVRRGLTYLSMAAIAWGTGGAAGAMLNHTGHLSPVAVSFWRFACGALLLLAGAPLSVRLSARFSARFGARFGALLSVLRGAEAGAGAGARTGAQTGAQAGGRAGGPSGDCAGPRPVTGMRASASGRPVWRVVLLVGPALAVCQAAYFAAIAAAGVALATMITMGASTVFVALGGRVFLRERLSRTTLAGVGLAVAGLLLLAGGGAGAGAGEDATAAGVTPAGVAYALLSALAYSGVTLMTRRARPEGLAAWGFAAGAACLLPFAAADGLLPQAARTGTAVMLVAYLAAVPTALAYGLFFAGLGAVGGTTAAVVALLEPLVAALIGVALLGERMTPAQVCGGLALMAAVAWLGRAELTGPGG
ncbi:DMT family transporter [Microbispora sp. NPDC049125]|uniref:DMT family transporter n=1 Tax=Microbispora sp. NPDC049125 TaxID=3154929 RepID=UPI0034679559